LDHTYLLKYLKDMILVTGATGHLGGSIIQHLVRKMPANQIVALVRDETKATWLRETGVVIRAGDYHNPKSLTAAFVGVQKAVLVSSSDFRDRLGQHKNVIDAAVAAGVRRLAYTGVSLKDVNTSVLRSFMLDHFQTEDYLKESGMDYTFMRHNLYAEMIPVYIGRQVLEKGIVFPGGQGSIPFALRDEMGEANANVLVNEGHEKKVYNIANDVGYSFAEMVGILSAAAGRTIPYHQPEPARYIDLLTAAGLPAHLTQVAAGFSTAMRNGEFDLASDDLKRLLGRKPAGLELYLQQTYVKPGL
jgi:NAD(P)H dehydrogenase (quinone)